MSMQVDLSTPLTSEERKYLNERGRYADVSRADALHGVIGEPAGAGDGTGPVLVEPTPQGVDQAELARLRARIAELEGTGDEDEDVPPYETWTVAKLDEELDTRQLSKDGNKADKVARLYEDDNAA